MSRNAVAKIVGEDAAVLVGRIERDEMEFGVHHRWTGEQVFTEAGVKLIMDRLAETDAGAALALRAEAKIVFAAAPVAPARELVEAGGPRHKPKHSSLDGYVPDNDL